MAIAEPYRVQTISELHGLLGLPRPEHPLISISTRGLPSVKYIAGELALSPNYLSSLLKALTGRNTQQHILDKLIGKAKEKISTTELSVSEISYFLGFDHPQSFSRLFKAKTGLSPLAFRQSFN